MAEVQAKIPFKSRKKTILNRKKNNKEICNIENENNTNTIECTERRKLKRSIVEDDAELKEKFDDETCSPTKISRILGKNGPSNEIVPEGGIFTKQNSITKEDQLRPLPSRETEIKWLETFLSEHLENEESASLYISGQPGTGKTACLSYLLQLPRFKEEYKQVYVNCLMMKSAAGIYNRICKELELSTSGTTEKACLSAIEKHLKKKHKMILLVLDEIDQLDTKHQSVLYSLFEWPARANSRLVLIGVANALDLTERVLPRLQARCSLRPQTMHFQPYTKQQIVNIFTTILAEEDKTSVFSPVALQMLAAKIASISGDMRRALDIGRRVIEVAKRGRCPQPADADSDPTVTVELQQVLSVLADVYGGARRFEADVDDGFPMQQKLILCSLMLMLTRGRNKDVVVGKLHDVYKRVAAARNIDALSCGEMVGSLSLLEARGVLRVARGGAGGAGGVRSRRLLLQWDEAELSAALGDKPLLAAVLRDTRCLEIR